MSHAVTIINQLRDKKFRITRLRKALIEELGISKKPLSAGEIIEHLKKKKNYCPQNLCLPRTHFSYGTRGGEKK